MVYSPSSTRPTLLPSMAASSWVAVWMAAGSSSSMRANAVRVLRVLAGECLWWGFLLAMMLPVVMSAISQACAPTSGGADTPVG